MKIHQALLCGHCHHTEHFYGKDLQEIKIHAKAIGWLHGLDLTTPEWFCGKPECIQAYLTKKDEQEQKERARK